MRTALRIPAPDNWRDYLEVASTFRGYQGFELLGVHLQRADDLENLCDAFRLPVVSIADLLPDDLGRYLPDSDPKVRDAALSHARDLIERAADLGAGQVAFDVGIDRIANGAADVQIGQRADLLRALLASAERHDVAVSVPLRMPAVNPQAQANALRLVRQVMHPACRIALDVFPDELPDDFDLPALLKGCSYAVKSIRCYYEPALGCVMPPALHERWAAALDAAGFQGLVVFCPVVANLEMFRREGAELAQLIADYWNDRNGA